MTYWALNAVFLLPAAAVLVFALLRGRRADGGSGSAGTGKGVPAALGITAVVLLLLTAVFDNLMIAAGLFGYNPERISGAFIGRAPLEDFAYALAAVLLLPALWMLLGKKPDTPAAPSAADPGENQ
ncbi:lycopene cyclase domain-containing protein [Arthrobacter sp. ATA002]|uniref:lycopene cyclase domain-containing protein n=1 Tax=Arthrobacter sp. ATA002 TaxID=2991715 RepID=UPI0022A695A8|nr:lycopene cyclase domain-containing protein [Arthrobacter sp. ATA002]WAP53291.1 lycopene cyclase domain-containing protein [Arthrobacter sp. ATA002]